MCLASNTMKPIASGRQANAEREANATGGSAGSGPSFPSCWCLSVCLVSSTRPSVFGMGIARVLLGTVLEYMLKWQLSCSSSSSSAGRAMQMV